MTLFDSLLTHPSVIAKSENRPQVFLGCTHNADSVSVQWPKVMLKGCSAFYFQGPKPSKLWGECQKQFIKSALQLSNTKPVRIQITHKTGFGEEICKALVDLNMINDF